MSASADDPGLLAIASTIADGTGVDWKDVARQLPNQDCASIVDELRTLERFTAVTEITPTQWGPYSIHSELGRGVFGRVFEAVDPDLQREIALKVIRKDASDQAADLSRGLKEARLLAKVTHPNVVRIYRVERIADEVGIAMELIRGRTLNDLVGSAGPFAAREAAVIGIDLCRAVAAVHAAEMIHGDVKAHNVMREIGGRTILMDFGAGRMLDRDVAGDEDLAGTPVYLAPEVFAGAARTKTSDMYSLGVLLYYLVTASYPIQGATGIEIARQHWRGAPRRLLRDARPELPDSFVRVVEQALADRPEDRFQSAGAFESALAGTLSGKSVVPPPPVTLKGFALAAAALLVALALGGYRMFGPSAPPADVTEVAPSTAPAEAAAGAYRIEAALYVERDGVDTRAQQGTQVVPGDRLSLQVRTSVPAYVYVVNEDEQGAGYLLFPLPGQSLTNPLPAGELHRLPGTQGDERLSWQVTSAGGREHFIIFANTAPLSSFDQLFASLSRPVRDKPVQSVSLSREAVGVLRGVGGIAATPAQPGAPVGLARDFGTPLVEGEETVRGVWIRQVTLENPVR
jgi:eukaryotic-like serine/threonine-protein kinase